MQVAGIQIVSRRSLMLDLPPSCLEFCPLLPSYFLVGTYNLQKPAEDAGDAAYEDSSSTSVSQKRNGSIVVYQLVGEEIVQVLIVSRPSAILDLRFQTCQGREDIVGAVSSTGTLEIFRFSASSSGNTSLTLLGTLRHPGIGDDVLFTQFAWHPTVPDTVAITTSQCGVHILQLGPDYKTVLAAEEPTMLHSLEAWCVAISPARLSPDQTAAASFTLYSGGDDSVLQYATCIVKHTQELGEGDGALDVELPYPSATVRGHEAGVTAILPLPCGDNIVVTGSYDDHIRVYSIQPLHETYGSRKTKLLAEANLGGGVWRLRLVRTDYGDGPKQSGTWTAVILASCMHAGARIVIVRGSSDSSDSVELEVLGRFEEHKSMNYASDFQPGSEGKDQNELVCVSTSFYDKLLCLWSIRLG